MEAFLNKYLAKITFLNLSTEQYRAEFASHIFFSTWVPYMAGFHFGVECLHAAAAVMIGYVWYKESFKDGHLYRMFIGTEKPEQFKDFYTDLSSRLLGPTILLFI